uniref:Uncharacterized protein n=1 Tax=Lygus hesperus TaxID=30085 RepID=A0A0A9YAE4_LYGHE
MDYEESVCEGPPSEELDLDFDPEDSYFYSRSFKPSYCSSEYGGDQGRVTYIEPNSGSSYESYRMDEDYDERRRRMWNAMNLSLPKTPEGGWPKNVSRGSTVYSSSTNPEEIDLTTSSSSDSDLESI